MLGVINKSFTENLQKVLKSRLDMQDMDCTCLCSVLVKNQVKRLADHVLYLHRSQRAVTFYEDG